MATFSPAWELLTAKKAVSAIPASTNSTIVLRPEENIIPFLFFVRALFFVLMPLFGLLLSDCSCSIYPIVAIKNKIRY
jgi:hypothetical protein